MFVGLLWLYLTPSVFNDPDFLQILDAGCSEGKLLSSIKLHCPDVEEIIGIDIDKELLMMNRFRLKPLVAEYLFKRSKKLRMALFHGMNLEQDY